MAWFDIAVFFTIVTSITTFAYIYVIRKFTKSFDVGKPKRRFLYFVMFLTALTGPVSIILRSVGSIGYIHDLLAIYAYSFMGVMIFAFLAYFSTDLIRLVVGMIQRVKQKLSAPSESDIALDGVNRREFLGRSGTAFIAASSLGAAGIGLVQAKQTPRVEHIKVSIPNLPNSLEGFRIVQFTDLHVGPTIRRGFVEKVADVIDQLPADLIVFTGDLVDGSVPWLKDEVAPLKELSAPYGRYYVTGNHEYYSGALPWIHEAERMGYHPLMNEHNIVQVDEARLMLAGVTDYNADRFYQDQASDPLRAFKQGAGQSDVNILLAHQPRSIYKAAEAGFDLQLSGHTHGGQFFPGQFFVPAQQPFVKGLHQFKDTWVYTSKGTGYWGPPNRLGVPSEITLIELSTVS